jgi:hypothetical protein
VLDVDQVAGDVLALNAVPDLAILDVHEERAADQREREDHGRYSRHPLEDPTSLAWVPTLDRPRRFRPRWLVGMVGWAHRSPVPKHWRLDLLDRPVCPVGIRYQQEETRTAR